MLARTGAEQAATQLIRATLEDAASLGTLVARYRHARDLAARDALRLAVHALPPGEAARVLADPAAPHLARTLAWATGHAMDPARLLRSGLEDHAAALGIPFGPPADAPLPWWAGPDVGHPGWLPYLQARAQLIRDRAQALGSLPAAHREQYAVTDPDVTSLGEQPEPGTTRAVAYRIAAAHQPLLLNRRAHRRARILDVARRSHRSDRPCLSSEDLA